MSELPTYDPYLPSPPAGISVQQLPQGLEITLPWSENIGFIGHFRHISALAACVGFASITSPSTSLLWLLVALATIYHWAYLILNTTTVVVGPKEVSITHGPLPAWAFGGTYALRDLRFLSVQSKFWGLGRFGRPAGVGRFSSLSRYSRRTGHFGRFGGSQTYTLRSHLTLLNHWSVRQPLDFVEECVRLELSKDEEKIGDKIRAFTV